MTSRRVSIGTRPTPSGRGVMAGPPSIVLAETRSSSSRPSGIRHPRRTKMATVADEALSIQEQLYPGLTCFGCGHANPAGLRLRSYSGNGLVTATFQPWPEHDNGLGHLNGGIISTLLDCHSAAAVALEAESRGWTPLPGADLAFVTAGL